ncbi:hypothetical protein AJ78_07032 [Emergomyces pasteurianus Ep9510]|uniref:Extracellular mutant protein 11 C-terminal domain-containing protein n=1 Tax=Emergomyces pasteurianus Ep9510 TaxID=1447872 RepID=A0A1J9QB09_9EURO|nr:hypothetical protein AJ78_07032 [Emergomyces pasteurianus Ep9510]
MAVGEYVRAKALQNDILAPQGSNHNASNPSRELVANMARVTVPATRLNDKPSSASGMAEEHRPRTASKGSGKIVGNQTQSNQIRPRDMFDTDVETVDDSTTTATSIIRGEEGGMRDKFKPGPPPSHFTARDGNDLPSNVQYSGGNSRGRNALEEMMLMELGSDPDEDGHDDIQGPPEQHVRGHEAGAEAGDEDEFDGDDAQIFDWSNPPTNGELLSWQKIEAALHVAKATPPPQSIQQQENVNLRFAPKQSAYESYADNHLYTPKATQNHYTGSRFVARSRFGTPNTSGRAPLDGERLVGARPIPQTSPSHTVILSPQSQSAAQKIARSPIGPNKPNAPQPPTQDSHDPYSNGGLFDITDVSAIDSSSSDSSTDNQQTYASLRLSTLSPVSSKRPLAEFSSDYPPNILETKTFADLQAESFDYNPAPTQSIFQPQEPPTPLSEKLTRLKALTTEQRQTFFASLNLGEWEESGDWIIEQFSLLLQRTKAARYERRKVAAVFEKEIERRYGLVEVEGKEIDKRLEEMRTGGLGVLRGQAL